MAQTEQKRYPVIFLDIDGVMNLCECDKEYLEKQGYDYRDCVSPLAVERLAKICKETDAHVVLNGTVSIQLWNKDPRRTTDPDYCLPDGTPMLDAMREKGIIIDGVSFDRYKHSRKIEGAAVYLSEHPEVSHYIFIEDGKVIDNEDKEYVIYKYPELKEIVEVMDDSMHVDTNIYVEGGSVYGQPIGLSDELKEKAIECLIEQRRLIIEPKWTRDEDDLEIER